VIISNNIFYGAAPGVAMTGVGLQPSDGSAAIVSNIVVCNNTFSGGSMAVYADGSPSRNVLVSNNTSVFGSSFAILGGGWKSGFVFKSNVGSNLLPMDSRAVVAGQWPLDDPSNDFQPRLINDFQGLGTSNNVSYGYGGRYKIVNARSNSAVYLDDSSPTLIPPGATIWVSNSTAMVVPLYSTTRLRGNVMTLARGQRSTFAWTNGVWQAIGVLLPPGNLRVIGAN
jgi:hypothetical protein